MQLHRLASNWARLGVGFNVSPARKTPDIEPLIIETSTVVATDARLFQMAVSWITLNAQLIAVHRLGALVRTMVDSSPMGLMLELAASAGANRSLRAAIDACTPASVAAPLFDIDRRSTAAAKLVRDHAMPVSRHWGRWIDEFELHSAAIRSLEWTLKHNRTLSQRLVLSDADLSAWLVLRDASKPIHAAEIARRAGISRMQALRSTQRLGLLGFASSPKKLSGPRRRMSEAVL